VLFCAAPAPLTAGALTPASFFKSFVSFLDGKVVSGRPACRKQARAHAEARCSQTAAPHFQSTEKDQTMKISHLAIIALLGAALAAPALAQPGPGMGGMGQGQGQGKGMRFGFNQDNTPGWTLMTAEERTAHRGKMLAAKTYEECKAIQAEHHQAMTDRAAAKGVTLPAPRQNGCDRMKARGLLQ
jgi:hypothetical protein